ncbi:hypothetical protein BH10CYA1_BH10CYA1_11550 [soil metagenome]
MHLREWAISLVAALYPMLFSIWPVLCIYVAGLGNYLPEELVTAAAACALITLLLSGLTQLLVRDLHKAAALSTFMVLFVWSFNMFRTCLSELAKHLGIGVEIISDDAVVLIYIILCALIILLFAKSKLQFIQVTIPMSILGCVLVAFNIFPIVGAELEFDQQTEKIVSANFREDDALKMVKPAHLPDIYYVIVDAFANADALKKVYGYDNQSFIQSLRNKGFYVANRSTSNYDRTALSIPSSLNMQYLDQVSQVLGRDSTSVAVEFRLMQKNRIAHLLKRMGYKFVNVSSGFSPTNHIDFAEVNVDGCIGNTFYTAILLSGVFAPLEKHANFLAGKFAENRLLAIKNIDQIERIDGPKFVLIHTMITHPPFIFDQSGGIRSLPANLLNEGYENKDGYLAQLKFAEQQIQLLVDHLLSRPGYQPIIVLQSDHGPASNPRSKLDDFINERMKILNAYYLPGPPIGDTVYQTITPVNSFRVIFNRYFKTKFPLLKDESYISELNYHFRLTPVTKEISFQ